MSREYRRDVYTVYVTLISHVLIGLGEVRVAVVIEMRALKSVVYEVAATKCSPPHQAVAAAASFNRMPTVGQCIEAITTSLPCCQVTQVGLSDTVSDTVSDR